MGASIGELTDGEGPGPSQSIRGCGTDLRAVVVDRDRAVVIGSTGERLGCCIVRGIDIAIDYRAVRGRCRRRRRDCEEEAVFNAAVVPVAPNDLAPVVDAKCIATLGG